MFTGPCSVKREKGMLKTNQNSQQIRILLIDDEHLIREGLALLLKESPYFVVVGEAATGEEAIRKVQTLRPDVVLLDLKLPDLHGVRVVEKIHQERPKIGILILSASLDEIAGVAACKAGALSYVLKTEPFERLQEAILQTFYGNCVLPPTITRRLVHALTYPTRFKTLCEAEIQVLMLVTSGYTNQQIADELKLSIPTVRTYLQNIYRTLHVSSRTQAMRVALQEGLVQLDSIQLKHSSPID
jgi:two-component system vancomycin resistance associated response regulator VraR